MGLNRWLVACLGALLFAGPVFAHNMGMICKPDGDRVRVEVFFDDETPAQEATVSVMDTNQKSIAQGKTDERGIWMFPNPAPGTYTITATSAGHRAAFVLMITDSPLELEATSTPSREEMTGTPWVNLGIGLGIIALLCALVLLLRKNTKPIAH
jgi:nickel transport protein